MQSNVTQEDFVRLPYNRETADGAIRPSQSYWSSVLRRMACNRVAMVSAAVILLIAVMSVIGPMMVPYGYEQTNLMESNLKPCAAHWFGTDKPGRDLWARVWVGARVSLIIGLLGAIIPAMVGVVVGGISGYFGGWVDMVITRFIDVCSCIPSLIYITLIMLLAGSGPLAIVLALSITTWTGSARMIRGRILQFKNREFVLAAKTQGAGIGHQIFRSILPNITGQLVVNITSSIPQVIFM